MKRPSQPGGTGGTRARVPRAHDRGAVLVVGLIILLVMTMLGISSMRTSALQELMAGHAKDNNSAFQAAEAAMQAARSYVSSLRGNLLQSTRDGGLGIPRACGVNDTNPASCAAGSTHACCLFRSTIANWETYPSGDGDTLAGNAIDGLSGVGWADVTDPPRFIIEHRRVIGTGTDSITFEDQAGGRDSIYRYYFSIAAVGFDPGANARAILQSTVTNSKVR